MRTAIETGPKGKIHVAYALDWPGLERNGKTPELAIANMEAYRQRYKFIAARGNLESGFMAESPAEVIIQYQGVGSTDFLGISFAQSVLDQAPITTDALERQLELLDACWQEFDAIAERVSPDLRKGPRGGGRDRDHIVRHVLAAELGWVKKLGIRLELNDVVLPGNRRQFHAAILDEIRAHHTESKPAQAKGGPQWALPFMIRHLAFHVLDHAWEMEDKDLSQMSEGKVTHARSR